MNRFIPRRRAVPGPTLFFAVFFSFPQGPPEALDVSAKFTSVACLAWRGPYNDVPPLDSLESVFPLIK